MIYRVSFKYLKQITRKARKEFIRIITPIKTEPIFILGNQKSGTTIIAALLSELTGLSLSIDLRAEIDKPDYAKLKGGEISYSKFIRKNKIDFSRDIIKEPYLTFFYQEICDYFPAARFVFIVRDPRDNIRSILNRLKIPGDLPQLPPTSYQKMRPVWQLIIDGSWLGLDGDNYIEMLAQRWNLAVDTFLKNRKNFILVRYEDFLQDKLREIHNLAQFLDLTPINDIHDKLDIQMQPRGNREIKWIDFFGTDNLSCIEDLCKEKMKQLDYSISHPLRH